MQPLKQLWHLIIPVGLRRRFYDLREYFRIQQIESGHWRSISELAAVDRHGNPIPWITYPATEYISQLDFSTKTVFEYGSGNSTLFWAGIAKSVVAVENDPEWYKRAVDKLRGKPNVSVILATEKEAYVNSISQYPPFDVIIVDGIHRLACAEVAIKRLDPTGMIILDNSETHSRTATLLRESGLIQVDMIGALPIISKVQATSFFLTRGFSFAPRASVQPSQVSGKRWAVSDQPSKTE